MFGLRSARRRAILAGVALTLFMIGVIVLTAGRNEHNNRQLDKLNRASDAATELEHARAQLNLQMSLLSGLALSRDAGLVDKYHQAQADLEQDLIQVRAEATDRGQEAQLALLDDLTARMTRLEEMADVAIPLVLEMEPAAARELAASYLPNVWDSIDAMFVDLDQLAQNGRADLAAERAAIDHETGITFWLVVALSAVGFVLTVGIVTMLLLSVLRPLSSLRLSARAIAAGNLQARAKVFGPEEVASLARDFNQMTDALAVKTKEYIATTNLTGDIICRVDARGKWTFLNDAACAFFGKPRERLLGTSAMTVMHTEDAERTRQAGREATARKGLVKGFVNRVITHAGIRVVEWNAHPLFDDQGEFAGIQMTGRDMTERIQMEEALRESEKRYRMLAENTSDLIWTMDLSLRYTYMSSAVTRMRGYTVEEIVGNSIQEAMTPASLEAARKTLAEELAIEREGNADPNRSTKLDLEMYCKDGSTIWTEMNMTFLRDSEGRPTGILGVTRDITQRKRVAEALEESERRYRLLAENTSDIIWTVDLSLRYTYMSPAVTRLRGYTAEEIVGTSIQEAMAPASLEVAKKTLVGELAIEREGNAEPNRSVKLDLEMCCKDGSTIWTEMNMTFLRDSEGKPTGILGVTRDITQRKRAAEALEESERRYRLLAENTSDLIWTMDLSLRYTYMSPAVTRLRGYAVEEIMSSSAQETLTPASLEVARKALAEEMAAETTGAAPGRGRRLELEMYCKDGSTIWTEMSMNFLRDAEGRPTGILGVTRDIGERKRAEEERERLNAELKTQAITDSLTGLYNHAHFYQRLAHEIDRSGRYDHRFALVMMDIDSFKHYNDTRGHQAGDEALRLVGECIQSAMRRSDLAFRYGGDEFVAILLDADVLKAQDIVRRINRHITARLNELGDPAGEWLGVSAGVVCFPEDATTADDLVGLADLAMYDAKRLAWARGVMGRARPGGPAGGPAVWVTETVHETQTKVLSGAASELAAALQDLTAPQQVLSETDLRTLAALSAAAEIKDPYIHGHQERTSRLAATVAKEMGLSPDRVRNLTTAGLLHDLGKVNVGEGILNKPGKLSESEFAEVKEHASFGAAMIVSGIGALQPLAPIVRHHHEQFDGNGYPDGLARENIPLEARILSVVDAFDAMTHERAYRKALSTEEALGEIQRAAGTLFDGAVVEAFLGVVMRGSESG